METTALTTSNAETEATEQAQHRERSPGLR